ncbi:hypothetical protein EVAR_102855_1 [Eumeta japonica]|uniref:Uncharacterized protein n=1 Tax=Eumeta variegata TaxID=151549 RepID=A0A4C1UMC5_EUMVA|nr:hypothetical protein EVAR_102855_1 [Eumeta japonica]
MRTQPPPVTNNHAIRQKVMEAPLPIVTDSLITNVPFRECLTIIKDELAKQKLHQRVGQPSEVRWSPSPTDTRDLKRVTSAWPVSWEGIEYLMGAG